MSDTRNWPPMPMGMPTQVHPAEAQTEVGDQTVRPPRPRRQPGGPEKTGPQPEQGRDDVPGRRLLSWAMAVRGCRFPSAAAGHGDGDDGQDLTGQKPEGSEEQPCPGGRPVAGAPPAANWRSRGRCSGLARWCRWDVSGEPGRWNWWQPAAGVGGVAARRVEGGAQPRGAGGHDGSPADGRRSEAVEAGDAGRAAAARAVRTLSDRSITPTRYREHPAGGRATQERRRTGKSQSRTGAGW